MDFKAARWTADSTRMKIMKRIKHAPAVTLLTLSALLVSMCAGLTVSRSASAQTNNQVKSESPSSKTGGALDRYATDMTRQALQGKLEAVDAFDAEINRVIAILSGTAKAPLLIGHSDLDRGMIARGV